MPRNTKDSAAIGEIKQEVAALGNVVKDLSNVVTGLMSRERVAPVLRSGAISSEDLPGPADQVIALPSDGEARLEGGEIETVDGPRPKEFLEELAFNEELVTVRLPEDPSRYAEPTVSTWVNGRHQLFVRGKDQTVKRKFVEALLRAKPSTYGNEEYTDPASGVRMYRYPKHTASKYPVMIVRDDSPRGRDWFRKLVAEAA